MAITYNYSTDWIGRDALTSGDPKKAIKASDFLSEWTGIQTAFASAAPTASPTFTGTVSATNITASGNVTGANLAISDWNTAFGWGDHSAAGYLTSYTETDPTVPSHVKSITTTEKTNWNTAYGWGDHGVAGYATADGANATGTWGISISGNAATATTATTATNCSRSVVAGTNLSGGGALTGDVTLNLAAEPSVTSVILGNFKLVDSGTDLLVQYNGASVFKITSTGAMVAEGEVTAFGTV